MDRDQLVRLLAEGLSLEQIGVVVGRHPSTVAYWLARHGLRAERPGEARREGWTPAGRAEPLVEQGITLAAIADASTSAFPRFATGSERYGLPRPHDDSTRGDRVAQSRRAGGPCIGSARRHGWTVFVIEDSERDRAASKCRMERVAEWRRRGEGEAGRGGRRQLRDLRLRPLPGGACSSITSIRPRSRSGCRSRGMTRSIDTAARGGGEMRRSCARTATPRWRWSRLKL